VRRPSRSPATRPGEKPTLLEEHAVALEQVESLKAHVAELEAARETAPAAAVINPTAFTADAVIEWIMDNVPVHTAKAIATELTRLTTKSWMDDAPKPTKAKAKKAKAVEAV